MKTKEEKIKVLVELDGWKSGYTVGKSRYPAFKHGDGRLVAYVNMLHYLTSYDAIIPLIQKQPRHILNKIGLKIAVTNDIAECFKHTPESLADILIEVIENEI